MKAETALKNVRKVRAGEVRRRYNFLGNSIAGAHAETIRQLEALGLIKGKSLSLDCEVMVLTKAGERWLVQAEAKRA